MAIDMFFPTRAVKSFIAAAEQGKLSPRHVNDVLKYDSVDVESIEPYLSHDNEWVRRCAAKVIAARGKNKRLLIDAAKVETDKTVLMTILQELVKVKDGMEELAHILSSGDHAIRNEMIQTFRRAGRADCLLSLAFSEDDKMVDTVKKYMEEQDESTVPE